MIPLAAVIGRPLAVPAEDAAALAEAAASVEPGVVLPSAAVAAAAGEASEGADLSGAGAVEVLSAAAAEADADNRNINKRRGVDPRRFSCCD